MEKINLKMLTEESKATGSIIFTNDGKILDCYNVSNENNIAAMAAVLINMSEGFSKDTLASEKIKQLVLESDSGLIIINKLNDNCMIAILTKDNTKAAIIKLILKKLVFKN